MPGIGGPPTIGVADSKRRVLQVERLPRPVAARPVERVWAPWTRHALRHVERRSERGGRYTFWTGNVGCALGVGLPDARADVPMGDYL